jgi:cytochrome b pre-mRNA-processing protein 3
MNPRSAVIVAQRAAGLAELSTQRSFVTSARALAQSSSAPAPTPSHTTPPAPPTHSQFSPSPLSPSAPPPKKHNALTVALVTGLARLMGYNNTTTRAIRVTSDFYDRCAERADRNADFWYGECRLPRTYQVWFQITTLHIHLLLTRFRALSTAKVAANYSQELINHFFIDAESRMRVRFGVQTSRLVKGYMKEMHTQQRGAILSLDEALAVSALGTLEREKQADADAVLASALWRNIWGAGGWGEGVGGVRRKVLGVDRPDDKKIKSTLSPEQEAAEDAPELAADLGIETKGQGAYAIAAAQAKAEAAGRPPTAITHEELSPVYDLQFAESLNKLVQFQRREAVRLANLSDEEIMFGYYATSPTGQVSGGMEERRGATSIATFSDV